MKKIYEIREYHFKNDEDGSCLGIFETEEIAEQAKKDFLYQYPMVHETEILIFEYELNERCWHEVTKEEKERIKWIIENQ